MEGGLASLKLGKYVSKGLGNIIERLPIPKSMEGATEEFTIQFGKTEDQIYHTFRHIDELGLNRSAVQNAILEHFPSLSSQLMKGKPLNGIINIGGQRLQYTAFEISEGIINIGRIHGL